MRIFIIAFLSQILLSCAPLIITYYEPISEKGKLTQSNCNDTVGPYDKIIFDGLHGVTIDLVSRIEKDDILICITITIPEDITVTFQDNLFIINNVSTGDEISQRVRSIYKVSGSRHMSCYDYPNFPTISYHKGVDIFTTLRGEGNAIYNIYLTIDNSKPDQFTLCFPVIDIEKDSFRLQRILFKLNSRIFIYPLNC